jgi:flagellar hook-length control protein FliK
MLSSSVAPILADPVAAAGGAPASSATDGNPGTFSRTLSEAQASGPADSAAASAATAPRTAAASTGTGQPAAATIATPAGETVPPGKQVAPAEIALLATQARVAIPSGTVEDLAKDKLGDADRPDSSAGDGSPPPVSNGLANAGLPPAPLREVNGFSQLAVAVHGPAVPDTQLSQADVQTAAATTDAPANANAPARVETALLATAGKLQAGGADAATLPRPDVGFSNPSPPEKGADAPPPETGDHLGLSLSDLGVRDSVPRSLVADGRDSGALAPNRPGFADALGQRIAWFARNDGGNATLELDPPNLGPLEVSVRVDKGEASVLFVAPQASVRDAVSQALPELRSLFAQTGLSLGNVNVSAGGAGHQAFSSQYASPRSGLGDASAEIAMPVPTASVRHGLVDLYA